MGMQIAKLEPLLLCAFFFLCYPTIYLNYNNQRQISSLAQAFLFHQLQTGPLSPSPPLYSSLYDNSSAPAQNYFTNPYNNNNNNNYLHNRQANLNQNHQQQGSNYFSQESSTSDRVLNQQQQQQHGSTTTDQDNSDDKTIDGCPIECHCNRVAQIADCSNRKLIRVPSSFPRDIKRIRLERNNITELGPYAFQGLKRLQRIDLSNNNLVRIDPLAFAGGLQSLNSLILYSNKLSQLPVNLFSELSQLKLLLLNANSLQCINRELFQPLSNLNLLSLYDNNIETLANGTFEGLKNIETIHLGKNPLACDCNLRWLADWLEENRNETHPIETSGALCEAPTRNQGKKLGQLSKQKFKCEANEQGKTNQIVNQCASLNNQADIQTSASSSSCPNGCICNGATVDCSRTNSQTESKLVVGSASGSSSGTGTGTGSNTNNNNNNNNGGLYELPDIAEDVPVYVTRLRINDQRIKRIRQTGLFQRLANSQKLDLGNNKIIDIEDNAINGAGGSSGQKPERVVFVLIENEGLCSAQAAAAAAEAQNSSPVPQSSGNNEVATKFQSENIHNQQQPEDPCMSAPKVNPPNFDSPCYNGGSCVSGQQLKQQQFQGSVDQLLLATAITTSSATVANYSCLCPPGFMGPLCEVNIDDCVEHQCQNGAMCVDGINSYKCICRDPTTAGEFCEQFNQQQQQQQFSTSSANSIAPIALPMIASSLSVVGGAQTQTETSIQQPTAAVAAQSTTTQQQQQQQQQQQKNHHHHQYSSGSNRQQQQILARSAEFYQPTMMFASQNNIAGSKGGAEGSGTNIVPDSTLSSCKRITQRKYYYDGNGCQSARVLKISECAGTCGTSGCCLPAKIKRRRIRMQCNDGASYVKTIDLVKKCACSNDCGFDLSQQQQHHSFGRQFNATQEDQVLQITRLDAVDALSSY